jgi:transcriptional regulator with XRE-family HTH domain
MIRVLCEAAAEPTVSGAIRRAVHRHGLLLPQIAKEAGLSESHLHEFLLGERTLRSDVLDRLARIVGFDLPDDPRPVRNPQRTPPVVAAIPPVDIGTDSSSQTAPT